MKKRFKYQSPKVDEEEEFSICSNSRTEFGFPHSSQHGFSQEA